MSRNAAAGTSAARRAQGSRKATDAAGMASTRREPAPVRMNGHAAQVTVARETVCASGETLEQCLFRSLEQYFASLGGAKPHALHEMVLEATERPLLEFVLRRCEGNQSAAADLLGINRNTLRRKLQDYGMH